MIWFWWYDYKFKESYLFLAQYLMFSDISRVYRHICNIQMFFVLCTLYIRCICMLRIQTISLYVGCFTYLSECMFRYASGREVAQLYQKPTETHSLEYLLHPKTSAILHKIYILGIPRLSGIYFDILTFSWTVSLSTNIPIDPL